jgi:triosephosphate isomerase
MTRRKLVAGNWKMFGLRADLGEVRAIARAAADYPGVDTALCVPFTLIGDAVAAAPGFTIGGQDCHAQDFGPHTGAISAPMLVDIGARTVIVGHSERRADQHETSQDAWAKAAAAHRHGLSVIVCCGETEAEHDAGRAERVVQAQIEKSVPDDASPDWFTLAYEPRWAIGTGRTPSIDAIASMHSIARAKLRHLVGDAAAGIRILYGGSVTGKNAAEIFAEPDIDGGLIGGASLTAEKFVPILAAAAAIRA